MKKLTDLVDNKEHCKQLASLITEQFIEDVVVERANNFCVKIIVITKEEKTFLYIWNEGAVYYEDKDGVPLELMNVMRITDLVRELGYDYERD